MARQVWIPPRARSDAEHFFGCHLCGETWPKEHLRSFQAHFPACIAEHRAQIAAAREPVIPIQDPELHAYMTETVGPRMIREGRLEQRPNERADG